MKYKLYSWNDDKLGKIHKTFEFCGKMKECIKFAKEQKDEFYCYCGFRFVGMIL